VSVWSGACKLSCGFDAGGRNTVRCCANGLVAWDASKRDTVICKVL
jgi:hypothetical protein